MHNDLHGYVGDALRSVFGAIRNGTFGDLSGMNGIIDALQGGRDHYIVCHDFYQYLKAQEEVDKTYKDYAKWSQMAIAGVAYSGHFSSDRTIDQYAKEIWKVEPVSIPKPSLNPLARTRSFANLSESGN